MADNTQKTKDRATRTPLKPRGELRCYGGVRSSINGTRRAIKWWTNVYWSFVQGTQSEKSRFTKKKNSFQIPKETL